MYSERIVGRETITVRTKTNGVIIRNGKSEVPKLPCSDVCMQKAYSMENRSKTMITAFAKKESRHFIFIWPKSHCIFACWLSSFAGAEHVILHLVSDVSDFTWLTIHRSVTHTAYIKPREIKSVDNKSVIKCLRLASFLYLIVVRKFSMPSSFRRSFDLSWLTIRHLEYWTA